MRKFTWKQDGAMLSHRQFEREFSIIYETLPLINPARWCFFPPSLAAYAFHHLFFSYTPLSFFYFSHVSLFFKKPLFPLFSPSLIISLSPSFSLLLSRYF